MPEDPNPRSVGVPLPVYGMIFLTLVQAAAAYFGFGGGFLGSSVGWTMIVALWGLTGLFWIF